MRDGFFEDENVTFFMVYNDTNDNKYNVPSYVKLIERPNIGYDFGGWGDVIMNHVNYEDYDRFLFINSSVYGPIIPHFLDKKIWLAALMDKLQDDVKLVGCTVNYAPMLHVQSYCWGVDKIFLKFFLAVGYFNQDIKNRMDAIMKCEVRNIMFLKAAKYRYHALQPNIGIYGHDDSTTYLHMHDLWANPLCSIFKKSDHNLETWSFQQLVKFETPSDDNEELHLIVVDDRVDENFIAKYSGIRVIKMKSESLLIYLAKNYLQFSLLPKPLPDQDINGYFVNPHNKSFPTKQKFLVISDIKTIELRGIPNVVYKNDMDVLMKDIEYRVCIQYRIDYKLKLID